ncbi:MAG: zinc ribbon domain-containing protein [Candidatus Lokiarchaeota archaeon]|nr:zinc ribbon domain-containing protein [Candidatus Lokiarchaeota archaeon]
MSSSNLEMKWNNFGKKLRSIGGLFILIIIPYIAFAALTIQLILIIVLINDLNDINRELKNPHLNEFRSRYLAASIVKFIGAIVLNIACAMLVGIFYIGFYGPYFPYPPLPPVIRFLPIIILFVIGFILMIVGSSIEIGAWDNLKSFIVQNKDMFPKNGNDAIEGAEKLKTGATLWVLGFLIIPIIIGWIFHLIGYFTLSKIADQETVISKEPIRTVEPQYVYVTAPTSTHAPITKPVSIPVQDAADAVNFCPLCGAKVNKSGLYCGECGTQVRD